MISVFALTKQCRFDQCSIEQNLVAYIAMSVGLDTQHTQILWHPKASRTMACEDQQLILTAPATCANVIH